MATTTTLEVSSGLVQTIQGEATVRGLTVEEFLCTIIRRENTLTARRKIEQEQEWWLNLPFSERAKYKGGFVAVHNRRLVDHDTDECALHRRIRTKYRNIPVLIMPAEGPREIRVFSPRLIQQ